MGLPTVTPAVRIFANGGPEVLTYDEYPLDPLGPTDVLVEVDSASVSGWDIKYRAGTLSGRRLPGREAPPIPQQLGREASGKVVSVGPQVTDLRPGDRVVAVVHPENPFSRETYRARGNLSTGVSVPGHVALGSYAKYLVRDQRLWLPLPDEVDLEQAAVALWSYSTSHRLIKDRLRIELGDTLLVTGGTGGMGEATIRLARLAGARVVATTRHAAKADALRELGVDEVVVVSDDLAETVQAIRHFSGGDGVSHAVDYTCNPDLIRAGIDAMRLGGVYSPAGGTQIPAGPSPIWVNDFTRLELTVVGVRGARHEDALRVLELLRQGVISSRIAARFDLADAQAAHTFYEQSKELVGRVVLKP